MHRGQELEALGSISRRCEELFGSMTLEKAGLRLMKSQGDAMIIRVRLSQIRPVLVSIALADPPLTTVDMSGSISRLRTRVILK
jgi:RNase P/RNase MRP subunit POP5